VTWSSTTCGAWPGYSVDDDLHVGEIGQRVDGRAQHRKHAGGENEKRGEQNQEAVPARPVDDFGQHDGSCVSGLREDWQPAPAWLLCRRGRRGDDPFAGLALDELDIHLGPGFKACSSDGLATLNSMVIAGHLRLATGP
jgi:hypothetical protein